MMNSMSYRLLIAAAIAMVIGVSGFGFRSSDAHAQADSSQTTEQIPVEPDMHEFMEYFFQPTYLRLKAQMAAEPKDNAAWKGIKADSLILAEGGNALLARKPEKDVQRWQELSVQVRDLGGQLYRSAKSKNYQSARQHYEAMLIKCNSCHQQFADGEHQLKP